MNNSKPKKEAVLLKQVRELFDLVASSGQPFNSNTIKQKTLALGFPIEFVNKKLPGLFRSATSANKIRKVGTFEISEQSFYHPVFNYQTTKDL